MSDCDIRPDRRTVLAFSAVAATAASLLPTFAGAADKARPAIRPGRAQPFDLGWRFLRGTGEGREAPAFDDHQWRTVDLPHDWSIESLPNPAASGDIVGPFDRKAVSGTATGFAVGGEGWYRKAFRLTRTAGMVAEIRFDGIYRDSDVWINGHLLGNHPHGYTPFGYDLTPYLAENGDNVLAVRVRNEGHNSRWYSGSGIYRHVWLDVFAQAARIARWGIGVTTGRIADGHADVTIATRLENPAGLTLRSRIRDAAGRIVWEGAAPAQDEMTQAARIASPALWSPDAPQLYRLETELRRGDRIVDRETTPFGVRIVAFDAATGMTINGVPTKLRGGCIHHDNGLVGAAAYDAAEDRKVVLLKVRGYNAVRASHNPFSPAFLDACDRHGMLVISEAFDAWHKAKVPQDYAQSFDTHWQGDLAAMVLSLRNHPSIIMWSIGNEIPDRNLPDGVEAQWRLANEVHRLDPSRPVTAAINDFAGRPVIPSEQSARPGRANVPDEASSVFLDVVGYNYKVRKYEDIHKAAPDRIFYGSESFPKDIFATWDLVDRAPWLLGDFVWTAMDYLGEAGIGGGDYLKSANGLSLGAWPWVDAFCGDLDLIGQQKGASLARDVVWGLSPLEIAVQKPVPEGKLEVLRPWGWSDERASWTWPGAEGKLLALRIYTAGDRVEVRLDGRLVETRPVTAADLKHIEVKLPYAAGTLEVRAFRGAAEIARRTLATAGKPSAIVLEPERRTGGAGRGDISYVAVALVDANGRPVGDVARDVTLAVAGPAELIGFGAGGPFAVGGFQSTTAKSWNGRALAILRGTGAPGRVRIEARAEGLRSAATTVRLA